jgi:hypothetical protein
VIPQLLKYPEAFKGSGLLEDPFGKNFLDVVARTPEKARRSRLKKIEEAFRLAVPQLINLSDAKDDAGAPHLDAIYARWRPNVGKQCEDQFSDGTLRLIGLFRTLLEGDSPLPTIQAAGTPIFLLTVWTSITAQRSSLPRGSIIGVMRGL